MSTQAANIETLFNWLGSEARRRKAEHDTLARPPENTPKHVIAFRFAAPAHPGHRGAERKVWRDIWSAGQGVGQIDAVMPVAQVVENLAREYLAARQRLQIN